MPKSQRYILVIEDDLVTNQIITAFIHSKGWGVITCCSLEEASEEIYQQNIELILLDYFLPDGSALTLLEKLRYCESPVPVIVISADNEYQKILSCFRLGALDYIIKPINLELFWHKVEGLLAHFSLEKQVKQQRSILEKMLYQKAREEQMARHLFEHLVNIGNVTYDFVKTFTQASANFSGDIILNTVGPNGNFFLIIADSTGHGLSAAMPILRVANTFRAMVAKGFNLVSLIYELNANVYEDSPGDRFVAAMVLEVDFFKNQIHLWNGGMPDALLYQDEFEGSTGHSELDHIQRYRSKNMALGILSPSSFIANIATFPIPKTGRICLLSDGLIEQQSKGGVFFGMDSVISLLSFYGRDLTEHLKAKLKSIFEHEITDDIAVCVLDFELLNNWYREREHKSSQICMKGEFAWTIKMMGSMLLNVDYLNSLNQFLNIFGFSTTFSQRVFTVVSELVTNAVDHGVLKLDSRLKNDPESFELYHSIREGSIDKLIASDWVKVELEWHAQLNELKIIVSDSGEGYIPKEQAASTDWFQISGRGLLLVKSLCKSYELVAPGNKTKVIMEL